MAHARIIDCHLDPDRWSAPRASWAGWLIVVTWILFLASCGGAPDPESHSAARNLKIELGKGTGGGTAITWDDVRLEVSRDVHLQVPMGIPLLMTSGDDETIVSTSETSDVLVDDEVVEITDGRLTIGAAAHGEVAPGDTVFISAAGVVVQRAGS
jgi:hypothetical protein